MGWCGEGGGRWVGGFAGGEELSWPSAGNEAFLGQQPPQGVGTGPGLLVKEIRWVGGWVGVGGERQLCRRGAAPSCPLPAGCSHSMSNSRNIVQLA